MRSQIGLYVTKLINILFLVIEFFLGLRLILRFFAASSAAPFVAWIYRFSDGIMAPFAGMFANIRVQQGTLDINALIALVLYAILLSVILWIIRLLSVMPVDRHVKEPESQAA